MKAGTAMAAAPVAKAAAHHDGVLPKCQDPRTAPRQARAAQEALAVVAASPWAAVVLSPEICERIGQVGFRSTGLHLAYLTVAALTAEHPTTFDALFDLLVAHGWPTDVVSNNNRRSNLDRFLTKLHTAAIIPPDWISVGRPRFTEDRVRWPVIIDTARTIVEEYETGVTLRQLFYRLVAAGHIPNALHFYNQLGRLTARARRDGTFPDLVDGTRRIERYRGFLSPEDARDWLSSIYRRDRTEGQQVSLYCAVEKRGLVQLLLSWFGDLGIPILSLGGYPSTPFCKTIVEDIEQQDRPAVLLYAGDFDPSGEDILRDFTKRVRFDEVVPVALNASQVEEYELPEMPGKETDNRAAGFIAKHGKLVQVELDALPPDVLRGLFQDAIDRYWNADQYETVLAQEQDERDGLVEGA